MILVSATGLAMFALLLQSPPGNTVSSGVGPVDKPARASEEIICKRLPPRVGTRLPGKVICLTSRQWETDEVLARELMDDTARRGLIRNRP